MFATYTLLLCIPDLIINVLLYNAKPYHLIYPASCSTGSDYDFSCYYIILIKKQFTKCYQKKTQNKNNLIKIHHERIKATRKKQQNNE